MRACLATLIVLACHSSACGAVESTTPCYLPVEPYPYKLEKSDPLYDTARDDHQRYLEELESYVNCLDWERTAALHQLKSSFELFQENFGNDAVLKYGVNPGAEK